MRVHIAENWARDGVDVYIVYEAQDYSIPYKVEGRGFILSENDTVRPGESFEPTLFIPSNIYTALRAAMIGEAIDNDDALKDTRMIRDRLLALVEKDHERMEKQADVMFHRILGVNE